MNIEIIKANNGWLVMERDPGKVGYEYFVFETLADLGEWIIKKCDEKAYENSELVAHK